MKKVLIVEDERPMAEAISFSLRKEGYEVDIALDGELGWEMCKNGGYDLILLDLMLPKMDGMEICRKLRQESSTPIIMLTAKDSDLDKVLGLEMGADDYITKPFNMRELTARVKAVLRRVQAEGAAEAKGRLVIGNIVVNEERHEVTVGSDVVDMPLMEYRLLEIFMKNPGKALPRSYLIGQAWGGDFYGDTKTLDVHIRRLREKIEEDPAKPEHIITVRGVGYRFEAGRLTDE
ncbi:MAG: DNA-binding response regulator [Actinobacteria bacterium RBG_19FT_COMBO_54_7]|uniref:DNA-binding response regulator n=1 Tax=Candidatus Solincola sediminis TaxID=1797199 RepID=A0A1F2WF85_9ACTN|nr:MAG: DNA-binding response regulator [Candidatus Solincola sediminis]OFW57813.1 MAG: DNA-binding response regulator [Candidatus Solincola sediminis]OFW68560.1 MAG: DNA-binding response regulator [Actinobacteria bacterium RBG_19FT_COMBO_54_7]